MIEKRDIFHIQRPFTFDVTLPCLIIGGSNKEEGLARKHKFLKVEGLTISSLRGKL